MLEPGETGEIVIRGPNVTAGYEKNPDANATAFAHGWFHTGDQGVLDADGYLRVTGRLKEIINRGGEKISPLEVDDVLMDHPAVAQVVTFAMPHDKLGEEVAAAIVLARRRELRPKAISALSRRRGSPTSRCRASIVILDEIPERRDRQAAAHRAGGQARPGMMRITVFGAGAIGGYLAAKLAAAGRVDLSIVARGAHLDAINGAGLRLIEDGQETAVPVRAAAQAEELGVQDYVVLALKAHSRRPGA